MIQIEGVEPSEVLLQRLADEKKPVILNFSRGKDSLATWIALRDHDIEVIPIHKSCPPGLKFVDESIDMYEQHFQTHIINLPSYGFYRMLRNKMYQPPERCSLIEGFEIPVIDRDEFDVFMRDEFAGGDQSTWITDGVRAADSATRRLAFKMHGAVKEARHRISPIWDYQKKDVLALLAREKVSLPAEYEWIGRSFDALRHDSLVHIAKHAPDDYATIKYWFPLIDVDLSRGALFYGN